MLLAGRSSHQLDAHLRRILDERDAEIPDVARFAGHRHALLLQLGNLRVNLTRPPAEMIDRPPLARCRAFGLLREQPDVRIGVLHPVDAGARPVERRLVAARISGVLPCRERFSGVSEAIQLRLHLSDARQLYLELFDDFRDLRGESGDVVGVVWSWWACRAGRANGSPRSLGTRRSDGSGWSGGTRRADGSGWSGGTGRSASSGYAALSGCSAWAPERSWMG